ncbi:30S ribosomal protein S6 [bacterium]|nr:MAG: 30S ribosomal protein S6 [bacterium]
MKYEIAFIIKSQLESTLDDTLVKIETEITTLMGEVTEKATWGKKRLAYPIEKNVDGFYYIWEFTIPSSKVGLLRKFMESNKDIVRSMITKL